MHKQKHSEIIHYQGEDEEKHPRHNANPAQEHGQEHSSK